jgi:hypothetical protein
MTAMKWIHNLLKCFSFSAVLFTFEACYGTMEDYGYGYDVAIQVVDSEGNGIPNVEVVLSHARWGEKFFADTTGPSGLAFIKGHLTSDNEIPKLKLDFNPLDGSDFQAKDTVVSNYSLMSNSTFTVTLDRK